MIKNFIFCDACDREVESKFTSIDSNHSITVVHI